MQFERGNILALGFEVRLKLLDEHLEPLNLKAQLLNFA